MIHNPFIPGTFWELSDGRRYLVDGAGHLMRVDAAVAGRIPPARPDTSGAVQLQLVPAEGGTDA